MITLFLHFVHRVLFKKDYNLKVNFTLQHVIKSHNLKVNFTLQHVIKSHGGRRYIVIRFR